MLNDPLSIVVWIVVGWSLLLWWKTLHRLACGQPATPFEKTAAAPWGAIDLLAALFSMLFFQQMGQSIVFYDSEAPLTEPDQWPIGLVVRLIIAMGAANLAAAAATLAWLRWRSRAPWSEYGFSGQHFIADLRLGVGGFVMLAVPVYGIQAILAQWFEPSHPLINRLMETPTTQLYLASGFSAVIAAPLAEEFFYRLLVQGWLEHAATSSTVDQLMIGRRCSADLEQVDEEGAAEPLTEKEAEAAADAPPLETNHARGELRSQGAYWPIGLSALLFALLHWGHGPAPIPLFFLALGLGYLYQQTHRITACIVVHFLLNAVTFLLLLFQQ